MPIRVVLAWLLGGWVGLVGAQSAPTPWMPSMGQTGYQVEGTGNPWSPAGATLHVAATGERVDASGSIGSASDAAPFRHRIVRLDADLTTHDAEKGAVIYLGVNGPGGKLDFISTDQLRVRGNQNRVHREIELAVPGIATRLIYGAGLYGKGSLSVAQLRLSTGASVEDVPPQRMLDAAIDIVRQNALHAGEVDWKAVEPRIRAMAADARVAPQTYPAIRALLNSLGDHHSSLFTAASNKLRSTQGGAMSPPVVEQRPGAVGYIAMPGYEGGDAQASRAFAQNMVQAITRLAPRVHCGWIVDLRNDKGGNMFPMLAGLRPLLGGAPLGSFRNARGEVQTWQAGDEGIEAMRPKAPDLAQAKVAVLTGPHTASSGEAVAVAFRGRPHTRSFGEATAGMSTANAMYPLPDGSRIVLTTSVDLDRNGHAYGDKIQPDQIIPADTDGESDAILAAASRWLAESCPPAQ